MNQPGEIRKKTIEGLQAGDRFSVSREFTQADIEHFAAVTRDFNPVHSEQRFIEAKGFSGPICHGLLVAAMISEIGGQIGWLASQMQFRFKKPVYPGDRIVCEFVITEVDERGRAVAAAEYRNQEGVLVLEGTLHGILPGERERQVMAEMEAAPGR